MPAALPVGPVPEWVPPPFVIDRLGTPEGRAHALAVLATLGDDRDEDEQRRAAEVLRHITSLGLRRWDPETGEQVGDDAA